MTHVLPGGFVKVRHYGLLAPRDRAERLALARRLLLVESVRVRLSSKPEAVGVVAPAVEPCCPHCGSTRLVTRELPHDFASPDTS